MSVFVNNKLLPPEKASVSVFDHGFLYGDGVFETMRAYEGVVFKLNEHLRRLKRSAALITLRLPYTMSGLKSIIYETLKANSLTDAYIRLTVSRGTGPIGLDPSLCPSPNLIVMTKPFVPYPAGLYEKGATVVISNIRRNIAGALNPEIKSMNFLNNIMAKIDAKKKKAFEALMPDHKGFIAEGTTSNVFMVKNGTLMTPSVDTGILNGITRQAVIRLAERSGIRVREKKIRREELYRADEVFITNTSLEVMPVRRVDTVRYTQRDITGVLIAEYKRAVKRETSKSRHS